MAAAARLTNAFAPRAMWRAGVLSTLCLTACTSKDSERSAEATVGVFYGGQIQRRELVEVSTIKPPKIGFRVTLPPRETAPPQEITYQIVRPGPAGRRVTKEARLKISTGSTHVDHIVALTPSSKMGIWNVRVTTERELLADRALYLRRATHPR